MMNLLLAIPITFAIFIIFMIRYSSKRKSANHATEARRAQYLRELKKHSLLNDKCIESTRSDDRNVVHAINNSNHVTIPMNPDGEYHNVEFAEKVLNSLANIEKRLTNIEKILKDSNEEDGNDYTFPSGFPLKTLEQFDIFEKETNEEEHNKMQHYLKSFGGRTHRDALNYYLRVMMTNTLAEQFNWTGKTNAKDATKRCFMNTKTAKIFWRALKRSFQHSKPTIESFEKDMTEVLRSYKQTARNARRPTTSGDNRPRKKRAEDLSTDSE